MIWLQILPVVTISRRQKLQKGEEENKERKEGRDGKGHTEKRAREKAGSTGQCGAVIPKVAALSNNSLLACNTH